MVALWILVRFRSALANLFTQTLKVRIDDLTHHHLHHGLPHPRSKRAVFDAMVEGLSYLGLAACWDDADFRTGLVQRHRSHVRQTA